MKRYSVIVKGKDKTWSFTVHAKSQWVDDWRDDGLEVSEVLNVVPAWAVTLGLTKIWCFVEDIFYFRNSFKN